ncbi:MAG: pectate lyase [Alistipes sp.]|nr:pectate lyase [Alistipes sp.]
MKKLTVLCLLLATAATVCGKTKPAPDQQIRETMKKATHYMMDVASYNGGFVWSYLPDLSRQWGEMEAKRTMVWIQPPGTPAVGHLMLDAYHATGDEYYYECAQKIAAALIWGQLPCGGWNYMFDFAGENSTREWYATVGKSAWRLEEFQHYYGNATFDDSGTMEAAKFLLRIYVEKYDPAYRQPLEKCINLVLTSQYPIGGWPQRYPLMFDHPFMGLPDYSSFITLNDDVIPENIDFLIQCYQVLGMQNLKEPIIRAMNCVKVLQQGAPYAGWGDQYTVNDLKPAHARSYEPRAINTATTGQMVRKLIEYYRLTGDTKYLLGIPAAIDFLESMKLPQSEVERWGRPSRDPDAILVPRFIDPDDGKPLYVHRKGSNVVNGTYYTDQNIENTIGHYSSAAYINIKALRKAYEDILAMPREEATAGSPLLITEAVALDKYYHKPRAFRGYPGEQEPQGVEALVSSLTSEGYWLSPIRQISNPYKSIPQMEASNETKYMQTMCGDEYDTSPYTPEQEVLGISTRTFLDNMTRLIATLASDENR